MTVTLSVSLCFCDNHSLCLSVSLSRRLYVCLSDNLSVCLSVCLSLSLSNNPITPSVLLSVSLSFCLYTHLCLSLIPFPPRSFTRILCLCQRTNYVLYYPLNPFTAMLAAPSLWKRPTTVPNLKSLRSFFPFVWAREKISIKMHSAESRFVIGSSKYAICYRTIKICYLQACTCALFSPEILQAGAVKGLILVANFRQGK